MEPLHYIFIILVGFGAAFVQRVSGFGLGIFAMMFLPHFLPSHTAAATISCLFSCCTTTYNSIKYRKNVAYKTAIPMLAAALITFINVKLQTVLTGNLAVLQNVIYSLILILIVIYRNAPSLKGFREKYNFNTAAAWLKRKLGGKQQEVSEQNAEKEVAENEQ